MGPDRKPLGRAVERASVLEREMRLYSRAMRPSSGEEGRNMSAFFPHISAKDASVLNERTNMRVTFIGERDLELRTPGNVIYELKRETTARGIPVHESFLADDAPRESFRWIAVGHNQDPNFLPPAAYSLLSPSQFIRLVIRSEAEVAGLRAAKITPPRYDHPMSSIELARLTYKHSELRPHLDRYNSRWIVERSWESVLHRLEVIHRKRAGWLIHHPAEPIKAGPQIELEDVLMRSRSVSAEPQGYRDQEQDEGAEQEGDGEAGEDQEEGDEDRIRDGGVRCEGCAGTGVVPAPQKADASAEEEEEALNNE